MDAAKSGGRVLIKDAIADITLQQVLTRPDEFDVIATLNLNGDYLSDALAAQVGGIGIAPGGNINYMTGHAVFEATHGTAPKYANLDKVNPGSVILSGEMMLRYMGWVEAADAIIGAMDRTIGAEDRDLRLRAPDGGREGGLDQRVRRRTDPQSLKVGGDGSRGRRATDPGAGLCARHRACLRRYNAEFRSITRRAPLHFDSRDWQASQRDAVERIELYDRFVDRSVAELRATLKEQALDRRVVGTHQPQFEIEIAALPDAEFTKTFFSSITRRLFGTVGVDAGHRVRRDRP